MKITELQNEIANCNWAIKAFEADMKWLAPSELSQAPSLEWIKIQKNLCIRQLNEIRKGGAE